MRCSTLVLFTLTLVGFTSAAPAGHQNNSDISRQDSGTARVMFTQTEPCAKINNSKEASKKEASSKKSKSKDEAIKKSAAKNAAAAQPPVGPITAVAKGALSLVSNVGDAVLTPVLGLLGNP